MEMLTYIPMQWIVVVPLNDFSECHSTSESSQTGPKVPSRPVQWLAAKMSGQQGNELQLVWSITHQHVQLLLHAVGSTQLSLFRAVCISDG